MPSNRVNLLAISSAASTVLEIVQSKLTESECCKLFRFVPVIKGKTFLSNYFFMLNKCVKML